MTNVLLLYEQFIPSVRLCAFEQLNYLKECKKIKFEHSAVKNLTKEMCLHCDIVVFVRAASICEEKLAKQFKKCKKKLIYSLDDDLLNVVDGLSSSEYYKRPDVMKRIKNIMSLCDILITPSTIIAKKYEELFDKTVILEEPCLTDHVRLQKYNDLPIKIGFAGSIDRAEDIDLLLSEAIRKLINKYGSRISFEFMGAKPNIIDEMNLTHYPYEQDYDTYKKKMEMLGWDIGLAPMPNTKFHNCKHYNKYVEYSSASIVGVYSNVEPYNRIIVDKISGKLCNNTVDDWVDAISWLVDHKEARDSIIDYNLNMMDEVFSINVISDKMEKDLPELKTYKAVKCYYFPLNAIKFSMWVKKIVNFFMRNGLKGPIIIIRRLLKKDV